MVTPIHPAQKGKENTGERIGLLSAVLQHYLSGVPESKKCQCCFQDRKVRGPCKQRGSGHLVLFCSKAQRHKDLVVRKKSDSLCDA